MVLHYGGQEDSRNEAAVGLGCLSSGVLPTGSWWTCGSLHGSEAADVRIGEEAGRE